LNIVLKNTNSEVVMNSIVTLPDMTLSLCCYFAPVSRHRTNTVWSATDDDPCQWRTQDIIMLRPEGQKVGVGFLERGSQPPPHQLGDLGECCKLPQCGSQWSPICQAFLSIFKCTR